MKLLFFGDIFGRPGREGIKYILPRLKKKYKPDLVLANAENLAHGRGISPKTIHEMREAGIDVFTGGNHIWQGKDAREILENADSRVVRPANYPPGVPGKGILLFRAGKHNVLVINLLGRVFMRENPDCPFRKIDGLLKRYGRATPIRIVDFHAETTSEKRGFGWHVDGRVSAVFGTHTHVPTADLGILPKGSAYITDVGMVGSYHSVIGLKREAVLEHLLTQLPLKPEVSESGSVEVNGVFLEIHNKTGRAKKVEQIREFVEVVFDK